MTDIQTKNLDKREIIFDTAGEVFTRYGFRRTSMNDIAQAAGISRPALYLMFENKEDLFRQLATHRQNEAIDAAIQALEGEGAFPKRFLEAILVYEKIYYEPVAQSPHGAEFLDVNMSVAADDMKKGYDRLIKHLGKSIEVAVLRGEASLDRTGMPADAYAELLMSSVGGQKKAETLKEFRRKVTDVTTIFLTSISKGDA